MSRTVLILCLLLPGYVHAQESRLGADFRGESQRLASNCSGFSFKSLGGCAVVLFTDHPVHIAAGSIAPQNGFGSGAAFLYHWTPNESWRLNWDVDGVASPNGSWRTGAYMTAVRTRRHRIIVRTGRSGGTLKSNLAIEEYPVFHLFTTQAMTLNKLSYFGLGPNTDDTARSYFGMREIITGTDATWPIWRKFNVSLYGEANGRFVNIRPAYGQSSPSINQLYTDASAPGLASQPAFAQFGEGIRIRPEFANGYVRLNYSVTLQEYVSPGASKFSFQRFTVDLGHQFPLYKKTRSTLTKNFNGPDDCSESLGEHSCPAITQNLEGSFGIRFLMNESIVPNRHIVPFYFQPTLGGSDINGNPTLGSYQDYRFRAPNTLLIGASFEHSIYGPLGITAMVDEGKVGLTRGDIDFTHLQHSYSVGLTLRAGGFPQVWLLYSWGGHEGTHTTAMMNTSVLGGSPRPSLY
ncbi:MAG: hypothetical protein EPN47_04865 [Acidobacteria bacterium]|nr:MAG: hypothetical protein EPN47_04865 [Acidobacteriota bacterium]